MKASYAEDEWSRDILNAPEQPDACPDRKVHRQVNRYCMNQGYLYWKGKDQLRLYIPNTSQLRKRVIYHFHGHGHLGPEKTFSAACKHVYWPNMFRNFVRVLYSCRDCQTKKQEKPDAGRLQLLTVLSQCWDVVCIDFLTELPKKTRGNDMIIVIVDKLSKRGILSAHRTSATAKEIANVLMELIFAKHNVPKTIVSDRDSKFTSES